ncbi:MAG: paraquat-inducible protein A [Alphaproteobacteria bacterium]|jgi:paraquat-inducible protein A
MQFGGIWGGALRERADGFDRWLGVVLVLALVLLVLGLFLPAIKISSFLFIGRELSLVEGVFTFLDEGNYFLFAVTFVFSILFPTFKIVTGLVLWHAADLSGTPATTLLNGLSVASKWSMLDVFIIALMILVIDGRLFTGADIGIGAIVFSVSVLTSTWAVRRLSLLAAED